MVLTGLTLKVLIGQSPSFSRLFLQDALTIPGLALLALTWTAAAEPQRAPRDEMVDRALAYLRKTQERDGSWASINKQPGITSLIVMAYLAAGAGPDKGPHADTVAKGLRWVLDQQGDSGLIGGEAGTEMYHHGIATLLLAQALPRCDGDLAKEIEKKLDKAVAVILQAQRTEGAHEGGWRYRIKGVDGDLSVSGWQIQALRAAKKAGREVPARSLDAAVQYLLKAQDPTDGRFSLFSEQPRHGAVHGGGAGRPGGGHGRQAEGCGRTSRGFFAGCKIPAALGRRALSLRPLLWCQGDARPWG
jgi:hypothetical protein